MNERNFEKCFAYKVNPYTGHVSCGALVELNCKGCSFYRTEKELMQRIKKYGGKVWWNNDDWEDTGDT